jgi:hypothetical protein
MTQEEIIYHNRKFTYSTGWHSSTSYKSIGRILNWLEVVGTYDLMEKSVIGTGYISYCKEKIATYEMDEDLMIPVLTIISDKYKIVQETQDIFIKQIKSKKYVVLKHLLLPDRGFRFYTENKPMNKRNENGEFYIQPIFWSDNLQEINMVINMQSGIASFNELINHFDRIVNKDKYFI